MIRRTMDATLLNEVANDPEVRPWLGGAEGPLDLTLLVGDPDNIAIEAEKGGFVLQMLEPGTYELHTLFLKEGRGKGFFAAIRAMFRYVFTHTDVVEILTKCPDNNLAAGGAAVQVGFRERFHRPDAWQPGIGVSYRAFTIDDWTMRDPVAQLEGYVFHTMLEDEKKRRGSTIAVHGEDQAHDHAAGAALLMLKAGQTRKAVAFYNRWAKFAGYAPIAMVSQNVVDIGDAVLEVKGDAVEVLLCR